MLPLLDTASTGPTVFQVEGERQAVARGLQSLLSTLEPSLGGGDGRDGGSTSTSGGNLMDPVKQLHVSPSNKMNI